MKRIGVKGVYLRLDQDTRKGMLALQKVAGESSSEIVERLIKTEMDRISKKSDSTESIYHKLEIIEASLIEIKKQGEVNREHGERSIKIGNIVYIMTIYIIKEVLRLHTYAITIFKIMTKMKDDDYIDMISSLDKQTLEAINTVYNSTDQRTPKDILKDILTKR